MKFLDNKTVKTFIKFGIVGFSGAIINMLIFSILVSKGMGHRLAVLIAFLVAVTNNFYFNFKWTFSARAEKKSVKKKYIQFFTISLFNFGLNLLFLELFINLFGNFGFLKDIILNYVAEDSYPKIIKMIANLFAIGVTTIFNFVGNHLITFRHEEK